MQDEGPDYLPPGYDPNLVLDLEWIGVYPSGKGHGRRLMQEFLSHPDTQQAQLIFCDPVPRMGDWEGSNLGEDEQLQILHRFYESFGFRRNPNGGIRMWRVQKGKLADTELPT